MTKALFSISLLLLPTLLLAQENEQELDSINGIYIPMNLEDCFEQINLFWNDSTKQQIANLTEEEFSAETHFGFGLWMRNNWRLWGGSRLSKHFNDLGIYHPDDMSGIIITSYHRQLTGKAVKLKKQIKYYQNYWKTAEKKEWKQSRKDFKVFVVGDTVEFNYNFGFINDQQKELFDNDTCWAKGIILKKSNTDLKLFIRLVDACVPSQSIIASKYDCYDQETKELLEKGVIEIMKVGDTKWMYYTLWDY